MEPKIAVRFYRDGDAQALNDLFNRVFARARTLEHWRWKYLDAPAAHAETIAIAEVDGSIVGAYGGILVRFKVADSVLLAALAVDLGILPGRRLGWTQMALFRAYNERIRALPVGLAFGFPNEVAYQVGKRLLGHK